MVAKRVRMLTPLMNSMLIISEYCTLLFKMKKDSKNTMIIVKIYFDKLEIKCREGMFEKIRDFLYSDTREWIQIV